MFKNINKSSYPPCMRKHGRQAGQASRLLLVLAIVVLVAVVITYLVIKMAEKPSKPAASTTTTTIPLPVYEQTLSNIRFVFESAIDEGDVLLASNITNSQYVSYQEKDLNVDNTGAKFIQVTVGAQDMGTENIDQGSWDIENIVDSQGRNFVSEDQYVVAPWLPNPNLCGALLKPAFDPTPCTKIYEVSKESTGLKIRVGTGNATAISSGQTTSFLLDLIVK